VPNRSRH